MPVLFTYLLITYFLLKPYIKEICSGINMIPTYGQGNIQISPNGQGNI